MRLVTFQNENRIRPGVVRDDQIIATADLGFAAADMLALIAAGPAQWARLSAAAAAASGGIPLADVQLLAPIPRPRKNVICLGLNYAAHAREKAASQGEELQLPEHPIVFTKAPTSVNAPYGDIPYDARVSTMIDWECELGVIIGRGGRHIPLDEALDHVFGYTVLNDISARDIQWRHKQYFLGKSLDGACPMGPWLVTADEIPDPQGLRLQTHVNGVLKQDDTTANQIFDVATTISILSRSLTLEPGDVIATGTPEGVGFARSPQEFLVPGDVVRCTIAGIGAIENRVVAV